MTTYGNTRYISLIFKKRNKKQKKKTEIDLLNLYQIGTSKVRKNNGFTFKQFINLRKKKYIFRLSTINWDIYTDFVIKHLSFHDHFQ